jgi:hypothetical protein
MTTFAPLTAAELFEFESLCNDVSSNHQATRSTARFTMNRFVDKHGKENCDIAFAALKEKWAKEDE